MTPMDKDQAAIKLFRSMVVARDNGELPAAGGIEVAPPRVRLAEHVDLAKADSECGFCGGDGIADYERHGETLIPVVCRCVRGNGGVHG